MVSRLVDRAADRQMNSTDLGLLEDDALNVFLCGTGSPLPDPTSAAACTIVVAGGKIYVVDVGPGSQEVAQLAGIPPSALAGDLQRSAHVGREDLAGEAAATAAFRLSPVIHPGARTWIVPEPRVSLQGPTAERSHSLNGSTSRCYH